MGGVDLETMSQTAEMATRKPTERQFQDGIYFTIYSYEVVPVPDEFSRGRWKCWDYRDIDATQEKRDDILEFTDMDKGDTNVLVMETTTIGIGLIQSSSIEALVDSRSNYNITTTDRTNDGTPVKERESLTIVVASIAPAPLTPQHGTPQSLGEAADRMTLGIDTQVKQTKFITELPHIQSDVNANSPTMALQTTIEHVQTISTMALPQGNVAASIASQASRPSTSEQQQAVAVIEEESASTAAVPTPNVAAIDNKIEQAMDLVKTHLTFAVREEVDVLRQTIADLELKVASLETENQVLRQYAPGEVVNQLGSLVQQKAIAAPSAPAVQALPPPKMPAGFCSSTFANSLNNVVADVRHELAAHNAQTAAAAAAAAAKQHEKK